VTALRGALGEGVRYFGASALALAIDLAAYSGLIRLAGVHYLLAAPVGFGLGLGLIYLLSVRWVFAERRLGNPRVEFAVFALIGFAGMGINELVIYAGVDRIALGYEQAKLASAAVVFCFNFVFRKLLLFTRFR
jgi:putative flippase GtrA